MKTQRHIMIQKNLSGRYDLLSEYLNMEFETVEDAIRAFPSCQIIVNN